MKINIVGGGPAGLYFSILMKARNPNHEIQVYERSSAVQTWGWGVVFSQKTLGHLLQSDRILHERLQPKLCQWNDVVILYHGEEVRVRGNPFASIARLDILKTLQERAAELGIALHFEQRVDASQLDVLRQCDLLIGADGVSSIIRERYSNAFGSEVEVGQNKFIWLGTQHLFDGLTMGFVESEFGAFACHAYRFSADTSTFIAECSEETWRSAGFEDCHTQDALPKLAAIFQTELGGRGLLSNDSHWIQFREVKNRVWYHENIILLGDALHTAHFSIGSGTKLALEDAIVLADCLGDSPGDSPDIKMVGQAFATARRPAVEKLQRAAESSRIWFENIQDAMGPTPHIFAHRCMTRSGRVDMEALRQQDPAFVAAYEYELDRN